MYLVCMSCSLVLDDEHPARGLQSLEAGYRSAASYGGDTIYDLYVHMCNSYAAGEKASCPEPGSQKVKESVLLLARLRTKWFIGSCFRLGNLSPIRRSRQRWSVLHGKLDIPAFPLHFPQLHYVDARTTYLCTTSEDVRHGNLPKD